MPHISTMSLPLALAGLIAATAAFAQAPPTIGPRGDHPPPPPPSRSASVHIDRGPDRSLRFDLHCAESDTTRTCADIAVQLVDKLNADVQVK